MNQLSVRRNKGEIEDLCGGREKAIGRIAVRQIERIQSLCHLKGEWRFP